jgi:hypothetical protein
VLVRLQFTSFLVCIDTKKGRCVKKLKWTYEITATIRHDWILAKKQPLPEVGLPAGKKPIRKWVRQILGTTYRFNITVGQFQGC